jgi:hypothetical protein
LKWHTFTSVPIDRLNDNLVVTNATTEIDKRNNVVKWVVNLQLV